MRSAPLLPVAAAAGAIALFVGMDAAMKAVTLAIGAFNAMFWRSLVGVAASGTLWASQHSPWPEQAVLRVHLIRGAVSTAMALTWFWGLARLPIAEAVAFSFIAPLIALYLAAVLLGERVGSAAIGGSLLAFAGVVLIVLTRARAPVGDGALEGAAAILTSALLYAYNIVLMRRQALVARPVEIVFFQNLVVGGLLLLAAPVLAEVPPAAELPGILLSAALSLVSALLFAWAYARAEAQRLATLEYTALVWGALFGWLVFGETVAVATVGGAALIVAGCWLAARPTPLPRSPAEAA